jgi:hypothetical protein
MMKLTVKDNGVRVANPSHKGTRVNEDQIKQYHSTLLDELGFNFDVGTSGANNLKQSKMVIYVQGETVNMSDSERLIVVWREDPFVLSVQRGDFFKNHKIGGEYDLYDFVSEFIQSVRDVWVEGAR